MHEPFAMYSQVRLLKPQEAWVAELEIHPVGSRGTIVHMHGNGVAYEVEIEEYWDVISVQHEDLESDYQ